MRAILPPHVLAVLEADPRGQALLASPSTGASIAVWGAKDLSDEVRGWANAVAMLEDPKYVRFVSRAAVPHALAAFVALVRAGHAVAPRAWSAFEKLLGKRSPPAGLADVLPLASTRALDRAVADRLAPRVGVAVELPIVQPPHADAQLDLLRRLAAHWDETHDEALEQPIAWIGQQVAHARGPLVARAKPELEKLWHATAAGRDPGDVDRLLDTPWPEAWKYAAPRAHALAAFPPDPRIAIKLAAIARRYETQASWQFHAAVDRTIARSPVPVVLNKLLRANEAKHAIYARTTRPADPALLAEAMAEPVVRELGALWAQHVEHPGDLDLRAVLADALIASGDPRGEFIALQLRIAEGTADAGAPRRSKRLLDAHGELWAIRVPHVITRVFERGFLVRVESAASNRQILDSLAAPAWRTIEDLTLGRNIDLVTLVARTPLLHTLFAPDPEPLARLAAAGRYPAIRALGAADWLPADRRAFPNLAVLGGAWVQPHTPRERIDDVARAVRALAVNTIVHVGPPRDRLADIIATLAIGPPELRLLVGENRGFHREGWRARILRDERRAEVTRHPSKRTEFAQLVAALRTSEIPYRVVDAIDLVA